MEVKSVIPVIRTIYNIGLHVMLGLCLGAVLAAGYILATEGTTVPTWPLGVICTLVFGLAIWRVIRKQARAAREKRVCQAWKAVFTNLERRAEEELRTALKR